MGRVPHLSQCPSGDSDPRPRSLEAEVRPGWTMVWGQSQKGKR
jgi:hypothetical protein